MVAARLGGGSEMGNQEGRRRSRWSGCVVIYAGQATGDRRQAIIKSKQQERALNSEQSNGSEGQLGAIGSTGSTRTSPRKTPYPPIYPLSIHPLSNPYHPHPSSSHPPSLIPFFPSIKNRLGQARKARTAHLSHVRTEHRTRNQPMYHFEEVPSNEQKAGRPQSPACRLRCRGRNGV